MRPLFKTTLTSILCLSAHLAVTGRPMGAGAAYAHTHLHEADGAGHADINTFMEKLSYAYQKAFHTGSLSAFLVGAPGSFTVTTLQAAQNMGVAEFEILFTPKKNLFSTSLNLPTELGSRYQSYQGTIELSKAF
jgi:hypothetical protein